MAYHAGGHLLSLPADSAPRSVVDGSGERARLRAAGTNGSLKEKSEDGRLESSRATKRKWQHPSLGKTCLG